jgi:hypothetical protein
MSAGRLRAGRLRGICAYAALSVAALVLASTAANAKAATPVLEFAPSSSAFPVNFTATGGEVTAALANFSTVVHCTGSHGEGQIIGPRSTVSDYVFTGCKAQEGENAGQKCQSTAANEEEITAEGIEAELVFIDQAKRQVGMLLNPSGGVYMNFNCGGEAVEASGPFLSPVGPINQGATTSFTASLSRSGATQTPSEYENSNGEKRQAIPIGKRESQPAATTGVELSFAINPSVPLEIKAVTAAEIEAKQREEEAAAAKKRQEAEAAAAAAAKKRQEDEAAAAAAVRVREEEEAKAERLRLNRVRSSGLSRCRSKAESKQQRVRCETRVKKRYSSAKSR